jgi:hypothetical protein
VDIPEARAFRPHLRIARNHEEFVREVREALAESSDPDRARARQAQVAADSWERRARQLRGWIDTLSVPAPTPSARGAV